jgi:hypothetical protein
MPASKPLPEVLTRRLLKTAPRRKLQISRLPTTFGVMDLSNFTTLVIRSIGLLILKALRKGFCAYIRTNFGLSLTDDRSERAPTIFGTREHDIKLYCGVISNFLNYILRHDVCNEYQMNVMAALKLCKQAERELQLIGEVSKLLPGDFNIAASTLYGGSYHKLHTDYAQWDVEEPLFGPDDPASQNKKIMGMTLAEADRIFKTGIAFSGTYEHFRQIMAMQCHVVEEEVRTMEVCEIVLPTEEMQKKLIGAKDEFGHSGFALGIIKVKHWDAPDAQEEDMSDNGEEDSSNANMIADSAIDSFWLEENILEKCFIGMKLKATVRELSIGLKYIDEIMRVECSFYTYLETERLDRWKEPVLCTRPGPSVDDPEKNFADDVDHDYD